MFTQAILLAIVQVVGTFLTFGLKSGAKKRSSIYYTVRIMRNIQKIDIISSILFAIYGSLSGTAIGAATAVASGLVNTIILQLLRTNLEQKYEAIWTIEYHLVLSDKQRSKVKERGLPELTLPQAISLYRQHGLKEKLVHEAAMNYKGEMDDSVSTEDRVFAGKTIGEWKELKSETTERAGKRAEEFAIKGGKFLGRIAIRGTSAAARGIGAAGKEAWQNRKARKRGKVC
jgi:hypothetical protein